MASSEMLAKTLLRIPVHNGELDSIEGVGTIYTANPVGQTRLPLLSFQASATRQPMRSPSAPAHPQTSPIAP